MCSSFGGDLSSLCLFVSGKFVIFPYSGRSAQSQEESAKAEPIVRRCLRDFGITTDYSALFYRYAPACQLRVAGSLVAPMSKHSERFRLLSFVSLRCTLVTS